MRNFSYIYIALTLVFGVFLYDYLGKSFGMTFIDELLMVALLSYGIMKSERTKEIKCVTLCFVFYLVYSLCFGVACYQAIFTDLIIYLKPFVGLYVVLGTGMCLSQSAKKKTKRIVLFIAFTTLVSCVVSYSFVASTLMGHPSRLATLFEILGVAYYYCSSRTKKDLGYTMFFFCCSMLSVRSKSYVFVVIAFFIFYYLQAWKLTKMRFSTIFSIILCIGIVFVVGWEKFQFYFIQGSNADMTESFARPALYQGAFLILKDYFPFGSGFGSYACYASSEYYSPLYYKYGLYNVWGLSEDHSGFIADTFFPQLAQFGIIGVVLFIAFLVRRYKDTIRYYMVNEDGNLMKISLLVLAFFLVESSSDSTFVHNRGMAMMVLWGMIMNESKYKCVVQKK